MHSIDIDITRRNRIREDVITLENITTQIERAVYSGGLDISSRAMIDHIATNLEHKHGIDNSAQPNLGLENHDIQVSMERIKELLSTAKNNVKRAGKYIWRKILAFFKWVYGLFGGNIKKEKMVQVGIAKLTETANSKTSTTRDLIEELKNTQFDDSRAYQNWIKFKLKNNRYDISQLERLVEYCNKNKPEHFLEYKVDKFSLAIETNTSKWNKDLWLLEQSYLNHNFSMKRLDHIIKMKRFLIENNVAGFEKIGPGAKATSDTKKTVITSLKETITIVAELPVDGKAKVANAIKSGSVAKYVKTDYASSLGDVAKYSQEKMVSAIVSGITCNTQMRVETIDIIDGLSQLMAVAAGDASLTLYTGTDKTQLRDEVVDICKRIDKFIENFNTNALAPIPGLSIIYKSGDGEAVRLSKNLNIDFKPLPYGMGDVSVLTMNQNNDISARRSTVMVSNVKLNDNYIATCAKIEKMVERMDVDSELFDWADDWAVKLSYVIIAADKYSNHCDKLNTEVFKTSLKYIFSDVTNT